METKDKGQVVFYYNRDRRMENASASARFMMDHHGMKRPGIIRSLTATRSLRYLFFAVILMVIASFVIGYAYKERSAGSVGGVSLSASAMWFEGYVYVTVKRASPWYGALRSKDPPLSAVDIKAGDGKAFSTGVMQASEPELKLRFAAESKPKFIAILAAVAASDGGKPSSVELAARVE